MEVDRLIALYPRLYHMAEAGTWPSIRRHGLLCSNEVARLSQLPNEQVVALRREHREDKLRVTVPGIGAVVLRDQKPMRPTAIARALTDMSVHDWYELINDRVFFWVEEDRLLGLLEAREYAHLDHDVLTLNTETLVRENEARVRLCHMNSGNTRPYPHRRGSDTFKRIRDYPALPRGGPSKRVVELTVEYGVENIRRHVVRVRRMRGAMVLHDLPLD